jgi:hypothetical protein
MEQELRKKTIKRYLQGETPKSICTDLGRSKNWFSNVSGAIKVAILTGIRINPKP